MRFQYPQADRTSCNEILLAFDVLRRSAAKAASRVTKEIDHKHPRIALDASKDVLDRLGVKAPEQIKHGHTGTININIVKRQDTEHKDTKREDSGH